MRTIIIGRDSTCNVILNDNFVSRQHAQLIVLDNEQVIIKDLSSRNGTFVNGTRISESYLNPGDVLKCGNSVLDWHQYINPVYTNQGYSPVFQAPSLVQPLQQPQIQSEQLQKSSIEDGQQNVKIRKKRWLLFFLACIIILAVAGYFLIYDDQSNKSVSKMSSDYCNCFSEMEKKLSNKSKKLNEDAVKMENPDIPDEYEEEYDREMESLSVESNAAEKCIVEWYENYMPGKQGIERKEILQKVINELKSIRSCRVAVTFLQMDLRMNTNPDGRKE